MPLSSNSTSRKAAIVINPRSFRMSLRGRLPRIQALADARGVPLTKVSSAEEIEQAMTSAVDQGADLVVIIGGDGTLQGAVSALAALARNNELPALLMLGGGRTNYTARDLGSHARLLDTLAMALDRPDQLQTSRRHSLQLGQANQPDRHGFFIAGALVDHVIRDCHRYRAAGSGFLRQGHLSSAWRVFQLGLLGLAGRCRYRPSELDVEAASLGRLSAPMRLLLLTSLHHRREWIDPYADRGQGEIRLTAISAQAPRFWRRLYCLMRGRYHEHMNPEQGYLSGRSDRVTIRGLASISLDGQELDPDPAQPLEIRSGPEFRFLHP